MSFIEDYERWKLGRQGQSFDRQSYMERFGIADNSSTVSTPTILDWFLLMMMAAATLWLLFYLIRNRTAVARNAENFIVAIGALAIVTVRSVRAISIRITHKAKERADR